MNVPKTVSKILKDQKPAILYYTKKVTKECNMEWDDAQQELSITVWLSTVTYNRSQRNCELKKWVMTDLCFQALHLVKRKREADILESQALSKVWPLIRMLTPDHADSIIQSITINEILKSLPSRTRKMISMRSQGFKLWEIGDQFELGRQRVSNILNEVKDEYNK